MAGSPCSSDLSRDSSLRPFADPPIALVCLAVMHNQAHHVVLLGDSIFDNGAYVPGHPDVVEQVRSKMPSSGRATLLALDGAVTSDVARQLMQLPGDATQLIVSAGGNDALGQSHILRQPCGSVADGVAMLSEAQRSFARVYEAMLDNVLAIGLPTALCTIYDANYPPPESEIIKAALSLFNDVITRAAFSRSLPMIDLRLICNEADDYANPIEPSARGGEKIACAIVSMLDGRPQSAPFVVA